MKLNRNYNSGFTLVETLVASAIIIVAIAAIAVIISQGSGLNRDDILRRRAFQALEEVLERRDLGYRQYFILLNKADGSDENLGNIMLPDIGGQNITANIKRRLDKVPYNYEGTDIPGIKVTVTITYDGKQESLSTILTDVPLD